MALRAEELPDQTGLRRQEDAPSMATITTVRR